MLLQALRGHNSATAKERFINWEFVSSYGGKMVPHLVVLRTNMFPQAFVTVFVLN